MTYSHEFGRCECGAPYLLDGNAIYGFCRDPECDGDVHPIQIDRYRAALEEIAALNMPYRDAANYARHLARKALERSEATT